MDLSTKIERGDDYVFNEVDGEVVMMNIETGAYASLNETGKSIWNLLEEPKTLDSILDSLVEEYEIDRSVAQSEIIPFVEKLVEQKVVLTV